MLRPNAGDGDSLPAFARSGAQVLVARGQDSSHFEGCMRHIPEMRQTGLHTGGGSGYRQHQGEDLHQKLDLDSALDKLKE